jgi:saccharopine dehydrogenase-like NADP-dependent oxidoreductase
MLRILVIGATGVFGSRLVELLAQEKNIQLVLAGRTLKSLEALAGRLGLNGEIAVLDRDTLTGSELSHLGCDIVIDAAGPFQSSQTHVIDAAIAAGIHYLDLADGRDFVKKIGRFDDRARRANIAVVTGASSIPALSHAVIDSHAQNWQRFDTIRIGIFPGNRAPRGLAVVESILSYVGKPVRVFREGAWQTVPGWGMLHRLQVPHVGARWASVCDTPDQDLLVARYSPTCSAEFFAGLELSLLHLGLWLLSFPVRWGWITSLLPAAKPMLHVAKWFIPFGTDKGGMIVQARGADHAGNPVSLDWSLKADANWGPYVPTLAAVALIRKFSDGTFTFRGAGACVGMLTLHDFQADFDKLGLQTTLTPPSRQRPLSSQTSPLPAL